MYPVGSIYMTTNGDVKPFSFGTWERINNCFLLGSGDKYTLGDTGGEEKVTLTTSEMPAHTHAISATARTGL